MNENYPAAKMSHFKPGSFYSKKKQTRGVISKSEKLFDSDSDEEIDQVRKLASECSINAIKLLEKNCDDPQSESRYQNLPNCLFDIDFVV